ncbi:MAG: PBP1A family penicillin-binding protein [Spirochaetia bacterium]|nr:PBP1A family penicillin-binding protein [Spirochaetia bacterium]
MVYDGYKSLYNKNNGDREPVPQQQKQQPAVKPPPAPLKSGKNGRLNPAVKTTLAITIIGIFVGLGALAGIFIAYMQEVPEVADLKNYKPNMSTAVYDEKGVLISQLYDEQRTLVRLTDMPVNLQNAVIAKEDPRFFQHSGFDFKGILRATINNIMHGRIVEGASTITQQLARNLFLNREKKFTRKIKEAILALQIEKYYTKKEILELYFNQIFFGNNAYGVEAAARTYFGKHVYELNLQECAMLAALPQAPSAFNPYRYPEIAREKRNIVITKMAERGYISDDEKKAAIETPIELNKLEVKNAPYFVEYVRQQLEASYGTSILYRGGLRVTTTLDNTVQDTAQEIFNFRIRALQERIEKNRGKKLDMPLQGAMLAMDPKTGHIIMMIGGVDFSRSEFNRAVQAKRQTGSSFKPFVYTAAIASGYRVSDVIMDSPIVFQNEDGTSWKPENFSGKFSGPMIILNGLTYSKNVVTVKLLSKIGTGTVKKYANKMGITSPLAGDLTMGLGSSSLSLLEMVTGFCPLANGGMRVEPLAVLTVKDSSGKTLENNTPRITEAIPDTTAYIMTYMLENVVNKGTGKTVRNMGFTAPCAGKTGTTNDFTDAWYIGYTPDLVAGIWIGFDSKESMGKGMVGGSIAAPIWAEFMQNSYNVSNKEFPVPERIVFKKICTKSGMAATANCGAFTLDAPFVDGTEPAKQCALHSAVNSSNFMNEDMESYDISTDDWDEEESGMSESNKKTPKPTDTDDADDENPRQINQTDAKEAAPAKNVEEEDQGIGF